MKTIFIDFETYYDTNGYSLRSMTPVEYVLDPRFECIGAAVAEGNLPARWMEGKELAHYLAGIKDRTTFVSHNALFDMSVLAWRFGYVPNLMVDTLGMARAMLAHECKSLSLASVAAHLGIGVKGTTVHRVAGMGSAAIKAAGIYEEYAEYSCNDTELARSIFFKLMERGFPPAELLVMDTVLRCAIQPKFVLDQYALTEHLHATMQSKQTLLDRCGLTSRDDLMSNEKFAVALEQLGVDPPRKVSLTTGKETWAFAKTDPAFVALDEHDDPDVQALVAARLGIKSTIEETRTQRLLNIARLDWRGDNAWMPIPLKYSGAHTHRLSGDWKLNMQNLPRGGAMRKALAAPKGKVVVACDASQIEARLVAWFCGCTSLVQAFANGEDVYSSFASMVFGRTITKADKAARFIGKTAILGMGYGVGHEKARKTIKLQSKAQTGQVIDLSEEEARRIVTLYRTTYSEIPAMWRKLNEIIPKMTRRDCDLTLGPVRFLYEAIELPNGMRLRYHRLRNENDQWVYDFGGKTKRIYGGALLENIIQSLARIVVMDAAIRCRHRFARLGDDELHLAMQVHDELVYVVPEDIANVVKGTVLHEMTTRPSWAPDLPLAAEAEMGPTYGDAK